MDLTSWIPEDSKDLRARESEMKDYNATDRKAHSKKVTELPWSEKYRPEKLEEIVGNLQAIRTSRRWCDQWVHGMPKKKALLIYGEVGTGKTSISYALAREYKWEIVEMNASDKRSKELVEQIAGLGSQTKSFSGRRKLILVEEIDGLSGVADRGATQSLIKVIKESQTPIILTCNDIKNKKLSGLKVYCEQAPLRKLSPGQVVKRLGEIIKSEGIKVESIEVLQRIADNADGDMRSAINDLQALAQGEEVVKTDSIFLEHRDRQIDVYKAMRRIFKCADYATCRRIIWDLDEEPKNFIAWLDENIPVEYLSKAERARAYNQLSRSDIFLGRVVNRQYWGFLRYVNDLMTVGIGFSKDKPNFGFSKYRFPSLISKMGITRSKRARERSIAAKISPIIHESRKRIITDYLPLLRHVFERNQQAGREMIAYFDLEEGEVELLT